MNHKHNDNKLVEVNHLVHFREKYKDFHNIIIMLFVAYLPITDLYLRTKIVK